MEKLIERLDEKMVEWTPEETRKTFLEMADEMFDKDIMRKNHKRNPKEWHKAVKRYSRYSQQEGILNLNNGPIADIYDWQEANKKKIEWTEVRLRRNKDIIAEMNE